MSNCLACRVYSEKGKKKAFSNDSSSYTVYVLYAAELLWEADMGGSLFLTVNLIFLPAPPVPQEQSSPDQPSAPRPRPSATMNSSPHGSRSSIDILEELQLIAAQNLEKLDINKYYEVVRELGKGTYGKVDLVIHKIRGNN